MTTIDVGDGALVADRTETSARIDLPLSATAGALARDVVRRLCTRARLGAEAQDTALLLTTELVTNAIEHGGGPAVLDAAVRERSLRVTVADASPVTPRPKLPAELDELSERGRGLFLVDALASRWGSEPNASGKAMWFEVDLPRSTPTAC